ncbi:DUF5776 domain-containing protein [Lentilactobacillus kisonensis]|uniref:Carbohydrate binding module n=1 Tax=Lentilactobacillus kisonensis DSM 19906 = JCM 15041 TaxID=1423766 RepID=A0A0R1NWF3_9LACO|nr:DUF5776 domain-containing protein [Lentilactobacillus kisonensis]KRL21235.1 carbohydrate binding module [Lentilactobacillus kisonensis DSM 19906 = JCM 15041]
MIIHKRTVAFLAAITMGLTLGAIGSSAKADDSTINVDTTQAVRTQTTHVASGGLYGMSDSNTPSADLLSALKPKVFTQAPPGGQQSPNGLPPAGDFMNVASLSQKVGSKIIIRLPDHFKNFPYNFTSNAGFEKDEANWLASVGEMVQKAKDSGYASDIYGYELWNEPNWTFVGNSGKTMQQYYEMWNATYNEVKKVDPSAKIVGPSIEHWDKNWITGFLTNAKNNNTLPDVICWHELEDGTAASFPDHVKQLDAIEDNLGIKHLPVSINEYSAPQQTGVPGLMIHYIQSFENVPELDSSCIAFWYNYGRMDNLLTDQQKPNGGYWLYKWYGDMAGQIDKTSTADTNGDLASVANTTDNKDQTSVIFGGTAGNTTINVNNLDSAKFSKSASVQVKETSWDGVDSAVDSPKTIVSGTVPVKNGTVSVPVKNMKAANGYQLVVTPSDSTSTTDNLQYAQAQATDPIRVEAEDSGLLGTAKTYQGSYASGNHYVGSINDASSGVSFKVNALAAGQYKLEIGYANGNQDQKDASDKVTLNNKTLNDAVFPYTTGWTNAVPNVNGTRKVLQYGTVDLNKGENTLTLMKDSSFAELDYVQLTPVNPRPTPVNPDNNNTNQTPTGTITGTSSSSATSSSIKTPAASSSSTNTEPAKTETNSTSKATTVKSFKVYAKKSLYSYKSVNFTKNNRVKKYVVKSRMTAPTFTVIAKAKSANGTARYKLSDGTYITANKKYVANLYWQTKHSNLYVTNKTGLYEYKSTTLSKKNQVKHVKKGQALQVKKVVKHGATTRFQLTNGNYITGNKQFTSLTKF